MIREIISTNGPQTAIDDSLLKILGIVVAITWPVFTVLPHERFGGVLMLNGLLYGLLLLLSIILLPRPNLSKLIITILIFFLLFYLTPVIQSLQ